jgi:hypothetical protein
MQYFYVRGRTPCETLRDMSRLIAQQNADMQRTRRIVFNNLDAFSPSEQDQLTEIINHFNAAAPAIAEDIASLMEAANC